MDLWPFVENACAANGVDATLLLAMLWAESGLDPTAERWGARTEEAKIALRPLGDMSVVDAVEAIATLDDILYTESPDISFGLAQTIVPTVARLGVGDGTWSVHNVLGVRTALFDRATSIDCCARLLSQICSREDVQDWAWPELAACVVYNSGRLPASSDDWWDEWSANVDRYRQGLEWAARIIGGGEHG